MRETNNKKLLIACFKYAPGNWQHIKSFASCLKERNYGMRLMLSGRFSWMNREYADSTDYITTSASLPGIISDSLLFMLYKWIFYFNIIRRFRPDAVLFVMWHPLNYVVARLMKKYYPDCKLYIWMHEPYKVSKAAYDDKPYVFSSIEYLQEKMLPFLDTVILHSNRARDAFKIRYPDYHGGLRVVPLLYKDECCSVPGGPREHDISYIGNAARAKGIFNFLELARKNSELNWGLRLQLVTPSNIKQYMNGYNHGAAPALKIINPPRLSDEAIREACSRSYTVVAPYLETTQSGMVPVSFMCGTPVIGTDIEGLKECITDKKNGMLINHDFSALDVLSSFRHIRDNFPEFSINARKSYEATWSDSNWDDYYGWLGEDLA